MKQFGRVGVRYDDPRGGTWYGPLEPIEDAQKRYQRELAIVHGRVWLDTCVIETEEKQP